MDEREDIHAAVINPAEMREAFQALAELTTTEAIHAALNTYEVEPDVDPCVVRGAGVAEVVGANHRRLLARRDPDGLWIGGCLIGTKADVLRLAKWLEDTAEDMP